MEFRLEGRLYRVSFPVRRTESRQAKSLTRTTCTTTFITCFSGRTLYNRVQVD